MSSLSNVRIEPDDTRQKLIDAAEEVFAEVGFESATVRTICERAGIRNIGAVNYYFQGKDRLYIEAVVQALGRCADSTAVPVWGPDTPAKQKLADFIQTMLNRCLRSPEKSRRLWMRELSQPSAACVEAVQKDISPMAAILRGILRELLPEASEENLWLNGFSIVGQILYYSQNAGVTHVLVGPQMHEQLTPEFLAKHITEFTFQALGLAEGKS